MTAGINDALDTWSSWHCDISPLGPTSNYALDMRLADAFRMMLYLPTVKARLDWIQREVTMPRRRPQDHRYHAELASWWLEIWEAEKAPVIENRIHERNLMPCVL